jgi:hypothetical protein
MDDGVAEDKRNLSAGEKVRVQLFDRSFEFGKEPAY